MHLKQKTIVFLTLILLLTACKKDRLSVDVSSIELSVKINRFDELMFGKKPSDVLITAEHLTKTDREFFNIFSNNIIKIGHLGHPEFENYFTTFLNDSINKNVADTVLKKYELVDDLESDLTDAFKHYQYYFPEKKIPSIYAYIARFNESIVLSPNFIGIGLDQYLGSDCTFYELLAIPSYKRATMTRSRIVPDVVYSWGLTEFTTTEPSNLLSNMIYYGKALYFTEALCRNYSEQDLIGFTSEQLNWCLKNESAVWSFMIEKNYLFSTDRMTIQRFVGNAPYTNLLGNESPGKTAVWIGWQLVRSYMKYHPEVTLAELMVNDHFQQILNASNYHPE